MKKARNRSRLLLTVWAQSSRIVLLRNTELLNTTTSFTWQPPVASLISKVPCCPTCPRPWEPGHEQNFITYLSIQCARQERFLAEYPSILCHVGVSLFGSIISSGIRPQNNAECSASIKRRFSRVIIFRTNFAIAFLIKPSGLFLEMRSTKMAREVL